MTIKKKKVRVNKANLSLILNIVLTCLVILITWVLNKFFYSENLKQLLNYIANQTDVNNYGFKFNSSQWNLILIIVFAVNLVAFLFYAIFYKTRIKLIVTLLLMLFSIVIGGGIILFLACIAIYFTNFMQKFSINNVLFLLVPLIIILCTSLIILSNCVAIMNKQIGKGLDPKINNSLHKQEKRRKISFKKPLIAKSKPELYSPQSHIKNIPFFKPDTNINANNDSNNEIFRNVDHTHTLAYENELPDTEKLINVKTNNNSTANLANHNFNVTNEESKINSTNKVETSNFNKKELWPQEIIKQVWEKGYPIVGVNSDLYRKDYAGAWMFFNAFSNNIIDETNIKTYAWTIAFHRPLNQGGTSDIKNLDPLNVINAATKADNFPSWQTKIAASGNENKIKFKTWKTGKDY